MSRSGESAPSREGVYKSSDTVWSLDSLRNSQEASAPPVDKQGEDKWAARLQR